MTTDDDLHKLYMWTGAAIIAVGFIVGSLLGVDILSGVVAAAWCVGQTFRYYRRSFVTVDRKSRP